MPKSKNNIHDTLDYKYLAAFRRTKLECYLFSVHPVEHDVQSFRRATYESFGHLINVE